MINPIFEQVKCASRSLTLIPDNRRDEILLAVADAIGDNEAILLEANAKDLSRMEKSNPLYDRLQLTHDRLCGIASDMRHVAALPSPLGKVLKDKVLDNGLHLRRVSVPFGVIGMVFEARPNVAFDVFSLCFKSGNACVLKGGRDADDSNRAIVSLIHGILRDFDVDPNVVALLPATHEATAEMLNAVGYVDVCIPRGGRRLIDFVRDNAKVPVIETGAGVVHAYFDKKGDLEKGKRIINNAKTKIVLNLEDDEAIRVQDALKLTDTEIANITRFERGNGLISTNSNHITVEFKASALEKQLITTDRYELSQIVQNQS